MKLFDQNAAMNKKVKVLNLVRYISIKDLKPENDISLKIYYYLREIYNVQSLFVKSVINIPAWAAQLKPSLKRVKNIFSRNDYVDDEYGIPVKFFGEHFFLVSKINIHNTKKIPFQYFLFRRNLEKEVEEFKPDLIHAHGVYPDGYYALKLNEKYRIPYIITLRGTFNEKYNSKIYNQILTGASHLHTPSASLYNVLKNRFKVELLPHPLEDFWVENEKRTKKFDSFRLITVSRLLEMKNIDIVLRAVKILSDDGFDITYKIVGDGSYRSALERLTAELGIEHLVTFMGYKSSNEIKEYYKGSNIFVMLSRPETYGRSYFEAASQGLVIIGAKDTGADGHFSSGEGIFIQEDIDKLVNVIKNTERERFVELSENAQALMYSFRKDEIISRYYAILSKSASVKQGPHG
jgi:glycosyltransferase involved in cell wall biosynthesis